MGDEGSVLGFVVFYQRLQLLYVKIKIVTVRPPKKLRFRGGKVHVRQNRAKCVLFLLYQVQLKHLECVALTQVEILTLCGLCEQQTPF